MFKDIFKLLFESGKLMLILLIIVLGIVGAVRYMM